MLEIVSKKDALFALSNREVVLPACGGLRDLLPRGPFQLGGYPISLKHLSIGGHSNHN